MLTAGLVTGKPQRGQQKWFQQGEATDRGMEPASSVTAPILSLSPERLTYTRLLPSAP